ncbi:helix-hairpin-helix domain-containing protein [Candidatus Sumerlaeota bacterium]|nr:helix-hairpin-helix domain-containing protein [Candidatus Sumerlaeota bacterium]
MHPISDFFLDSGLSDEGVSSGSLVDTADSADSADSAESGESGESVESGESGESGDLASSGSLGVETEVRPSTSTAAARPAEVVPVPTPPLFIVPKPSALEPTAKPSMSLDSSDEKTGEASDLLDLNSATADELAALPGLDAVRAGLIVSHRASIGGFRAKTQLHDVFGITDPIYDRIAPLVTVRAVPASGDTVKRPLSDKASAPAAPDLALPDVPESPSVPATPSLPERVPTLEPSLPVP